MSRTHKLAIATVISLTTFGAVRESKAATVIFDLTSTSSDSFSSLVYNSSGIQLTATPTVASLINRNTNGLCVFSNRTGCGFPTGSNGPFIAGTNFTFDANVIVTGFKITATNICGAGCTPSANAEFNITLPNGTYGTYSFGQGQPTTPLSQAITPMYVAANNSFLFGTSTIFNPATGYQYRISELSVTTPAPAPLGIAGVVSAFSLSRRLRKRINEQHFNTLKTNL
jgi:hypothetical protein